MQRRVSDILGHDHVRQQPFADERFLDRLGSGRGPDDALVAVRAGILGAHRFDDEETRRLVLELLRDRFADARFRVPAPTLLLALGHVALDPAVRQVGRQGTPLCGPAAGMAVDRGFPRIHPDRLGDRARLVRELLERELELPRIHGLGPLAEHRLTEHVGADDQSDGVATLELPRRPGDSAPADGVIVRRPLAERCAGLPKAHS
jgi:hypothetical protein